MPGRHNVGEGGHVIELPIPDHQVIIISSIKVIIKVVIIIIIKVIITIKGIIMIFIVAHYQCEESPGGELEREVANDPLLCLSEPDNHHNDDDDEDEDSDDYGENEDNEDNDDGGGGDDDS